MTAGSDTKLREGNHMPPIEWLRERYYVDGGALKYLKKVRAGCDIGSEVGSLDTRGYRMTAVNYGGRRRVLLVHRIIMALELGRTLAKSEEVDHIDRNIKNNQPDNLRLSNRRENMLNTPMCRMGVVEYNYPKKTVYRAQIRRNGKIQCLGIFNNPAEAKAAYLEAAKLDAPDNGYHNILRHLNEAGNE